MAIQKQSPNISFVSFFAPKKIGVVHVLSFGVLMLVIGLVSLLITRVSSIKGPIRVFTDPSPVDRPIATSVNKNWTTYIDEEEGKFSFEYPSTWFNRPKEIAPNGRFIEGKFFSSIEIPDNEKNSIELEVFKASWNENLSLDRFTRVFKSPVGIIERSPGRELTKLTSTTIAGYPAVNFTDEYKGRNQTPPSFGHIYAIKLDNFIYSLSFYGNKELVKINIPVFDQILSTFKFLN